MFLLFHSVLFYNSVLFCLFPNLLHIWVRWRKVKTNNCQWDLAAENRNVHALSRNSTTNNETHKMFNAMVLHSQNWLLKKQRQRIWNLVKHIVILSLDLSIYKASRRIRKIRLNGRHFISSMYLRISLNFWNNFTFCDQFHYLLNDLRSG